jgi:hypothetical protein
MKSRRDLGGYGFKSTTPKVQRRSTVLKNVDGRVGNTLVIDVATTCCSMLM